MKKCSTAELRDNLSDIINQVCYGKGSITINRHGKPVAVIIPPDPEVIDFLERLEDKADIIAAEKAKQDMLENGSVSWEDLKKQMGLK